MNLNFRYNAQTGRLTAAEAYTVAQNNHLTDVVTVVSDAPDRSDFRYSLEFVCYDNNNVPRRQYVSPLLDYGEDGVRFALPNHLTQYAGHADMQLAGHAKGEKDAVFRSVALGAKAFDVEPSPRVLENALADTPNVLTEVMRELEEIRRLKENIVADFGETIHNDFAAILANYRYRSLRFTDNGKTTAHEILLHGAKASDTFASLPEGCEFLGKWRNAKDGAIWDFDTDTVTQDTELITNYATTGLRTAGDAVIGYTGDAARVVLPCFSDEGQPIRRIAAGALPKGRQFVLCLPRFFADADGTDGDVTAFECGADCEAFSVREGSLYTKDGGTIVRLAVARADAELHLHCEAVASGACRGAYNLTDIRATGALREIGTDAFRGCVRLRAVRLPAALRTVGANAFADCPALEDIVCQALEPPALGANALPAAAIVRVPAEALALYRAAADWTGLDVQPIGGVDLVGELPKKSEILIGGRHADTYEGRRMLLAYNRPTYIYPDTPCGPLLTPSIPPEQNDLLLLNYGNTTDFRSIPEAWHARTVLFNRSEVCAPLDTHWVDENGKQHFAQAVLRITAAGISLESLTFSDPTPPEDFIVELRALYLFR